MFKFAKCCLAGAMVARGAAGLAAQEMPWLNKLDDALSYESPNGFWRADLSGLADLEGYYTDQPPAGLIFYKKDFILNPRLSLYLENQLGEHIYSMLQVRLDRGFDPGTHPHGDARFDEYFLRYTPFNDGRLNIQAGKFATLYGNFVPRHDSWHNPFITAPLMYENLLAITDKNAPSSRAIFMNRKNIQTPRSIWVPWIWGPSYALGGAVFGSMDRWEYGVEVKHAGLASRPYAWDPTHVGFENPNYTGRLAYKPNASWTLGASASFGPYLLPSAEPTLPAGKEISDFNQLTVGPDISFAWRKFELWSEAYYGYFDVPLAGRAESGGYYLEAKQKLDEHWYVGLRWNQQFFGSVENVFGQQEQWDNNNWRIEPVVGYRLNRHLQVKLQYGFSHQQGSIQEGEQMVATQLTLKF
jgi:hypothetical protein